MTRITITIDTDNIHDTTPDEPTKVMIARRACVDALLSNFGDTAKPFIEQSEADGGESVWRKYVWWEEGRSMFVRPWLLKDYHTWKGGDTE